MALINNADELNAVISEMQRLAELRVYLYGKGIHHNTAGMIIDVDKAFKSLAKAVEEVSQQ